MDLPDIAVIVGARDIEAVLERHPALVQWARAVAPRINRLVGLCSGSFFLAAAGLLDGRRATTHWSVAPTLQAKFPHVQVEADAIYLREGRVWTSAGVTAGFDLALTRPRSAHASRASTAARAADGSPEADGLAPASMVAPTRPVGTRPDRNRSRTRRAPRRGRCPSSSRTGRRAARARAVRRTRARLYTSRSCSRSSKLS